MDTEGTIEYKRYSIQENNMIDLHTYFMMVNRVKPYLATYKDVCYDVSVNVFAFVFGVALALAIYSTLEYYARIF